MKTIHEKIMEECLRIEGLDSESLLDVYSYVQKRSSLLERYLLQKDPRKKCEIIQFPVRRATS